MDVLRPVQKLQVSNTYIPAIPDLCLFLKFLHGNAYGCILSHEKNIALIRNSAPMSNLKLPLVDLKLKLAIMLGRLYAEILVFPWQLCNATTFKPVLQP